MNGSHQLAISYRPIGDLIPYVGKARTHAEGQVALIAGSIREYGFTNPVLVAGANRIIAGHGRVMAARKLGLERVPVTELAYLSEAQKRAYVLPDNKLAERAGRDLDMLALAVADLQSLGLNMIDLGFTGRKLDDLLRTGTVDPREEDVPPVPEVPISRLGDVWSLGHHRLICGDATDAARVTHLNGNIRPHLMVSDPPYGVEYDPDWRNQLGR